MKCPLCKKKLEVEKGSFSFILGQWAYHMHETHGVSTPSINGLLEEILNSNPHK